MILGAYKDTIYEEKSYPHLILYQKHFLRNKIKIVSPFQKKLPLKFYLKRSGIVIRDYLSSPNFFLLNRSKSVQLANASFKKYLVSSRFLSLWADRVNLNSFRNIVGNELRVGKASLIYLNFRSNIKNLSKQKNLRNNSLRLRLGKIALNLKSSQRSCPRLPLLLLYTRSIKKFTDSKTSPFYQKHTHNTQLKYTNYYSFAYFSKIKTTPTGYYSISSLVSNKTLLYFYNDNAYSYLFTRHTNPFVLANLGVFIPITFLYKDNSNLRIYVLKKKMYSFLRINEYKMHVFRSKKSLMTNNLVSRVRGLGFFKKTVFTSHKVFYNYLKKATSEAKRSLKYLNNTANTFLNESILRKSNLFKSDGNAPRGILSNNKNLPPAISRVRFKPGYQRIWRHYRLALAESINFNYIYQKQLTRFLVKFYRKSITNQFSFNENSIDKIVIYSRLAPDKFTFDLFLKNKLIYFNSSTLLSDAIYVYKNDFIQLEISNWYYVFFRWTVNFLLMRKKKFKRLIFLNKI